MGIVHRLLLVGFLVASIPLASQSETVADPTAPAFLTGARFDYTIQKGDTLASLGARYGVSRTTLLEHNPGAAKMLVAGRQLTIDNRHLAIVPPHARITINVPQRMLFLQTDEGAVSAFPVAVGRFGWPTPTGEFTVIRKTVDPVWTVPKSIQDEMARKEQPVITSMPPSAANPLGARWIGLSLPSVGIHGTVSPASIYGLVSHGCIRLHPDDVAQVFEQVDVGDRGVVRYEPAMMALIDGRVFVEVHPDGYRRAPAPMPHVRRVADESGMAAQVDWNRVATAILRRDGTATDVSRPDAPRDH